MINRRHSQVAILAVLTVAFLAALLVLLLSANVQKPLDHDEHQFIASGALLAREHKLPYVDYAYFHMPNLVLVYAALFAITDHILLAARVFSTGCAWLVLGTIFFVALGLFRTSRLFPRFLLAAGCVVFLLTNPVFAYTSGKSWNHDLPLMLTLLAFVLHARGARRAGERRWVFFSGLCVGLAVGTRLSFAPIVLPFLGTILLYPDRARRQRWFILPLFFGLGMLLGLLPSICLFALAPKQFLFGNIGYARYNTLYRHEQGFVEGDVSVVAMTLGGKLRYLARYVVNEPSNLLLLLAFLFFTLTLNVTHLWRKPPYYFEIVLVLALIPFLLLGSFAPTPSFFQYFYAPIPFLLLAVLYGIASFREREGQPAWSLLLWAYMIAFASGYGIKLYEDVDILLRPDDWVPVQVHKVGVEIEGAAGAGQVLTLAPIFPLEGRVSIYEQFSTGSFAWRVAPFVPEEVRRQVDLVSEADLDGFLGTNPPAGILTGYEGEMEEPFIAYAQGNGYQPVELSNATPLWLAPR